VNRRVLLVSQPASGGCAVCVRDLAVAAAAAGWQVRLAVPTGPLTSWLEPHPVEVLPVPMRRGPHPSDLGALLRLRQLMRDADVVHLHSSKAAALGRLARLTIRHGPPCLFTPHGWSWLVGGRSARLYRLIERTLARTTTSIIAVSDEEAREGARVLGRAGSARITVIPNGVDTGRFEPTGEAAPSPALPLVVFLGRLDRAKGPDVAVQVLARMRRPAVLRLVGDGPLADEVRHRAQALGVAERVELVGHTTRPEQQLRAADVVLIPSRWEGMSLTMLEAFSCARPVVMTDVPGRSAADGVATIVGQGDVAALAEAVDALLDDPARGADLGLRARERVLERYKLSDRLEEVIAAWRRVLP
jgi:glycosyltransferase involved in cell wall biosynthesis